jgi:acetylglutamate kinase
MNENNFDRARILVEALPYIQKYYGKIIVVKYGGNAMINGELFKAVMEDIVLLSLCGVKVVVVHGGGPEINEMLKKTGKESKFVNGLRYTDKETMDIVQMVLCGKINKNLVDKVTRTGGRAIGLSGLDSALFQAVKLDDGTGNDYGLVGEIEKVNPEVLLKPLNDGIIPIIATVAQASDNKGGYVYNINADTAASKLAVALGAEKLILLTDICGLLRDPKDETTLIPEVTYDEIPQLKSAGIISGGMIPKIDCCADALQGGVKQTNILDGRVPHSILIELLTDEGAGTMFVKSKEEKVRD